MKEKYTQDKFVQDKRAAQQYAADLQKWKIKPLKFKASLKSPPASPQKIFLGLVLMGLLLSPEALEMKETRAVRRKKSSVSDAASALETYSTVPQTLISPGDVFPVSQNAVCRRDVLDLKAVFSDFKSSIAFKENPRRHQSLHQLIDLAIKNPALAVSQDVKNDLLCTAVLAGYPVVVETLIAEGGANVDQPGMTGQSPLSLALLNEDVSMIRLLLDWGADAYQQDTQGMPVYTMLENGKYYDLLADYPEIILSKTFFGSNTLLLLVIESQFNRAVDFLIAQGIDIHHRNDQGKTALHFACQLGNFHAVRSLLKAGAPCLLMSHNGIGMIHYSLGPGGETEAKRLEIIKLLLETCPDAAYQKTISGKTILDYAKERHWHALLEVLSPYYPAAETEKQKSTINITAAVISLLGLITALGVGLFKIFKKQKISYAGEADHVKIKKNFIKARNIKKINTFSLSSGLLEKSPEISETDFSQKNRENRENIEKYNHLLENRQNKTRKSLYYNKNAQKILALKPIEFFHELASQQQKLDYYYHKYENWAKNDRQEIKKNYLKIKTPPVPPKKSEQKYKQKSIQKPVQKFTPELSPKPAPVSLTLPKTTPTITELLKNQSFFSHKASSIAMQSYLGLCAQLADSEDHYATEKISQDIYKLSLAYFICRTFNALLEMYKQAQLYTPASFQINQLRNRLVKCVFKLDIQTLTDAAALMKKSFEPIYQYYARTQRVNTDKLLIFCDHIFNSRFFERLDIQWIVYQQEQKYYINFNLPAKITELIFYLTEIQNMLKIIPPGDVPALRDQPDRLSAVKMLLVISDEIYQDFIAVNIPENPQNFCMNIRLFFEELRRARNSITHNAQDFHEISESRILKYNSCLEEIILGLKKIMLPVSSSTRHEFPGFQ